MKKTFIYVLGALFCMTLGLSSCTDYLDRDEQTLLSKEDVFKNFKNFQGYVEVMYNVIPDVAKHYWVSSFNWGEDEIITTGAGEYLAGYSVDKGSYRDFLYGSGKNGSTFLDRDWSIDQGSNQDDRFKKSLWGGGWYAIRQANIGLKALEDGMLTDATQEQRNFIKGQLLFFRAWFYFELTTYWGGLPYMTEPLNPQEQFRLPRMSYQECADHMIADFREAAKLLPVNWDDTDTGRPTKGNNIFRPNKIWALSYLGKAALYAGSPLMVNGTDNDLRTYDANYCKIAADALGEVISMVDKGQCQYKLVDFADYSKLFYERKDFLMPGSTEAIMRSPSFGADSYWRQMNSYQISAICNGDGIILCPTANYVNYYGMANGQPLYNEDGTVNAASGFDEHHPWKGRDPRFYHDIVYDGVKMIKNVAADVAKYGPYEFANFYNGGNGVNDPKSTSRTGYLNYKFIPIGANLADNDYGWGFHMHLSWLRLAEVYLLYAEATAEGYGSATAKASGCNLSAEDAINVIRDRAGVDHVAPNFTASVDKFMSEVRRERAVELAFEGHRFNDLRRWKLLTVYPYTIKTKQTFDRDPSVPFDGNAPKDNAVVNFEQEVLVTRKLSAKHYWLPFRIDDVTMYPEFGQNPGW